MLTVRSGIIASSLSVLSQVSRRLIGIVSLIILARILTPEDYGLVAIALIFYNFIEVVSSTGGASYLLSRESLTDELVYTNWTVNFILRGSLAVLLAIASLPISNYYDDPRLVPIILVFSLQIFIGLLSSPGMIYKHKNQELGAITRWGIISRFITTGITIAIAVVFETYWALIIGQFLVTVSELIASYVIAPKRLKFSVHNVQPQWKFSKWVLLQSIVNFFRSQIDAIFVSTTFPKAVMGAYNSMRYYANIPTTMLINPAITVLITQFSQFKNNPVYFTKQVQVVLYILSLISAPIIYFMSTYADFLVDLILGEKWVAYSRLLAIFSYFTIVMVFNTLLSQIVMLKDSTRLLFFYSIGSTLLQVLLFVSYDFRDVYELASYKIGLDIISAALFFILIVATLLGKHTFLPLILPMLPAGVTIFLAGLLTKALMPPASSLLIFAGHALFTISVYSIVSLMTMWILRQRVHCFGYLFQLVEKSFSTLGRKLQKKS